MLAKRTTTGRRSPPVTPDDFTLLETFLDDFGQEHFIEVPGDEVERRLRFGGEFDWSWFGRLGGHCVQRWSEECVSILGNGRKLKSWIHEEQLD